MDVKRTEQSSKLTKAFKDSLHECLIQNLPVNIFLVDHEGYICWANERLLKRVNSTLEAVEGLHISVWDQARWEYVYEVIVKKEEIT